MPERIISDAVERLDEAIHQQERLVEEVRALRTSNSRLRAIIAGLAVLIVFGGVGLWTAFRASSDAKDAAHAARDAAQAVATLQAQQEADRAARAADACARAVSGRDDNRAMWLYLLDRFADSPNAPDARAELEKRLPPLTCVDDVPTPVTED